MRRQVVTAARVKFVEEVRRPIGFVYLQAVAEDRVGNVLPAGLDEWIGDSFQMVLNRLHAEMVENKSLRADRCAFHLLPGAAGDEEEYDVWAGDAGRQSQPVGANHLQLLSVFRIVLARSS